MKNVAGMKEQKILAEMEELEVRMKQVLELLVPSDPSKRLCEDLQNVLSERFILAQNEHSYLEESLEIMRKGEKNS